MKQHLVFDIEFKKNPYKGTFIAFEGVDASGKSTQVNLLKNALEKKGREVIIKHPFEGEIGEFVRKILSGEKQVPPVALQYLISANRQVQQMEIIDHLQKGNVVVIDRYIWSAVAYGIFDKGLENTEKTATWLLIEQSILSMYHQFLLPNYTFYLDVSARIAAERLSHMEKTHEIYEDREKIDKIAAIYKWLIKTYPEEFVVIDGTQPEEKITSEIVSKMSL